MLLSSLIPIKALRMDPISKSRSLLIPPQNSPASSVSRFNQNWASQKGSSTSTGPSETSTDDKTIGEQSTLDVTGQVGKRGRIVLYKVTDVFEDEFTLQSYESHELFGGVESALEDYCEMVYAQNKGKPVTLEILQNYAVFNEDIKKWVRCVLIDILAGGEGSTSSAVFRQVDYGGWFKLLLTSQACPGEYVQEVPEVFFQFPAQGATASQCENPVLSKRFPIQILKEMKNSMALCRIEEYFPPKNNGDVPHLNVAILNVFKAPNGGRTSLSRRRKSI